MTDASTSSSNKRHSIAGKVATPKISSGGSGTGSSGTASPAAAAVAQQQPPLADALETLKKVIGARIKLMTAAPHSMTYEGTLFTACPVLNIVAINTRTPSTEPATANTTAQPGDYHIIPVSRIQNFQILSMPSSDGSNNGNPGTVMQPPIGPVDISRLKEREQARIAKLKEDARDRGKGVTQEAQAIYDSFKRINMPIRWHNQEMIVHEAVIIAPPYRIEDCKGAKDKQEVLNRVKKVLDGERRKIRERTERDQRIATATPPAGLRKGG